MYRIPLISIVVLPLVHGVAYPGPSPTIIANPANKAAIGWTPRPTPGPRHRLAVKLGKRQTDFIDRDPGFCGWVESGASTVACPGTGLTCALYTATNGGMAGCCAEDNSQDCGWVNSCVNYDSWTKKSCDAECQSNTFVRKCTNIASPYCVTWTYPSDQVADYGCADYNSGVVTVEQSASDLESVYFITLPTYSGLAVTGWDGEASSIESDTSSDLYSTSIEPSDPEATDPASGSNSSNNHTPKPHTKKKKTPVGLIAGAVVGGLVVLFLLGAALIFFCVKQRKAKQLANNQTIIAAQQAQPPQPEYKPAVQSPPVPTQPPPPQQNGYFTPQDHKINYQAHVQEQGLQSPVMSNPPTPAPPYVQPYYAAPNAPPLPAEGTYEVDAITTSQARLGHHPNAFEMGPGK